MIKKILIFLATSSLSLLLINQNVANAQSTDSSEHASQSTENIYEFTEEVTTFNDLAVLERVLEEYKIDNPTSTEEEQNMYLIKLVESGGLRDYKGQYSPFSVGDYLPGYNKLNSKERELAKKNPVHATLVYSSATKANNSTENAYGYNGYQDNSDAFRHVSWNAFMKKSLGSGVANTWATAHEATSSGVDKEMDLYNNAIGRTIVVSNVTDGTIIGHVKTIIKNGSARRIVNKKLVKTNGSGLK